MPTVSVVISSFNQGELIADAVESVRRQTQAPQRIVVVDDGSTDRDSLAVLDRLADHCEIVRQENRGVSAARNAGISSGVEEFIVVLDGDDRLAPEFIAATFAALQQDPEVLATSSWLRTHGVLETDVKPSGGRAPDFLHRNACPATMMVRRSAWVYSGGYDETMRDGFEDWDFCLSLLADGGRIDVVPRPLIHYRTAATSSNVRSMEKRLTLYGQLIDKHRGLFDIHLRDALLAQEARAMHVNERWENVLLSHPAEPLGEVTYGDGGMAAAVRIATRRSV
jgi:glycosyltransferase involved in cell wall biosynthesis